MGNSNVGIGGRHKNYILIRNPEGYIVSESRYIWEQHNGKIPKGMFIHHINGNSKDNRIENLQRVTRKEHGAIHSAINRLRKENNKVISHTE